MKDEKPLRRFRLLIPLARAVGIDEHTALWKWGFSLLFSLCGEAVDPSTKDACRLFYTLRTNKIPPWLFVQEGTPLDPDMLPDGRSVGELLRSPPNKDTSHVRSVAASDRTGLEQLSHHLLKRATNNVRNAREGERNSILNCQAFAIGQLIGAGLLRRDVAEAAFTGAGLVVGLSSDEVAQVVKRGLDAGEKCPKDLNHVRPQIVFKEHGDLSDKAWAVIRYLRETNDPPFLFLRDRKLVRLARFKGIPVIDLLTNSSFRTLVTELARFADERTDKEGEKYLKSCDMPLAVAEYVNNLDNLPFPPLDAVVYSPTFTPSGRLVVEEGYNAELGVYLSLGAFRIRDIPDQPAPEDVEWAKDLLINHLLQGFPMVGDASVAHAIAIGLLPFVRFIIDGPVGGCEKARKFGRDRRFLTQAEGAAETAAPSACVA